MTKARWFNKVRVFVSFVPIKSHNTVKRLLGEQQKYTLTVGIA